MALTKAEINAVAQRVLDLADERNEARRAELESKWAADAPERERVGLLRRVSKLETAHPVSRGDFFLGLYCTFLLCVLCSARVGRKERDGE